MFIRRKDALFVYRTVHVFPYPKLIIVWTARYIKLILTRLPVDFQKPVDFSFTSQLIKGITQNRLQLKLSTARLVGSLIFYQKPFLSDSLFKMFCKIKIMMKLIGVNVNPAKVGQMADLYVTNFGMGLFICLKFALFIFLTMVFKTRGYITRICNKTF